MTLSLYIQCVAMYLLGQAVDLFLLKIPELRTLYRKANEDFCWKKYWQTDWNVIIGTQVVGAMLILGLNELTQWKPQILDYIKWFFGGVGAVGSSIIVSRWSQAKKYIMNVIDNKTNIADKVTGQESK